MTVLTNAMKGLVHLSTLTRLELQYWTFNKKSLERIQPDSWPCLRCLELDSIHLGDPTVAIRVLFHLTGLEELYLQEGKEINGLLPKLD